MTIDMMKVVYIGIPQQILGHSPLEPFKVIYSVSTTCPPAGKQQLSVTSKTATLSRRV